LRKGKKWKGFLKLGHDWGVVTEKKFNLESGMKEDSVV